MARYRARLRCEADGSWVAAAVELPHCWSRGQSEEEALTRLRDEIRYRIEFCPCSGVDEEYVQVDVDVVGAAAEASRSPRWSGSRPATPANLSGVAGCPPPPDSPAVVPPAPASRKRAEGWRRWDD
jgi:predicted RNase H-like HicB family nuclease